MMNNGEQGPGDDKGSERQKKKHAGVRKISWHKAAGPKGLIRLRMRRGTT